MRQTVDGWVATLFMVNQQEERTLAASRRMRFGCSSPKSVCMESNGSRSSFSAKTRRQIFEDGSADPRRNRNAGDALPSPARVRCRPWNFGAFHLAEPLAERATQVETEWVPCSKCLSKPHVPPKMKKSRRSDDGHEDAGRLPKDELIASLRILRRPTAHGSSRSGQVDLPSEKLEGHEETAKRAVVLAHGRSNASRPTSI